MILSSPVPYLPGRGVEWEAIKNKPQFQFRVVKRSISRTVKETLDENAKKRKAKAGNPFAQVFGEQEVNF